MREPKSCSTSPAALSKIAAETGFAASDRLRARRFLLLRALVHDGQRASSAHVSSGLTLFRPLRSNDS
jgi:hypothetical protein